MVALAIATWAAACSDPAEEEPGTGSTGSPPEEAETDACPSKPEGRRVVDLDVFGEGGYAVLSDGTLWCWTVFPGAMCPEDLDHPLAARPRKLRDRPCMRKVRASYANAIGIDATGATVAWSIRAPKPTAIGTLQPAWIDATAELVAWGDGIGAEWFGRVSWNENMSATVARLPWSPLDAMSIATTHACSLLDGEVSCVGNNSFGQLGDGTIATEYPFIVSEPVHAQLPSAVSVVEAESGRTHAIDVDGAFWTWGGDPISVIDGEPVGPLPQRWDVFPALCGVERDGNTACAWTCEGEVSCWGANRLSLIEKGPEGRVGPTRVRDLEPASRVTVESDLICALKTDGTVWCRGHRGHGGGQVFEGDALPVQFLETWP